MTSNNTPATKGETMMTKQEHLDNARQSLDTAVKELRKANALASELESLLILDIIEPVVKAWLRSQTIAAAIMGELKSCE